VRIAAPPGKHDDLAMVLILAARIVMWLKGESPAPVERVKDIETDHQKLYYDMLERRRREAVALMDDDD
jgi:regulator of extracellular matrix RemA (YlzA/DUF370 family)